MESKDPDKARCRLRRSVRFALWSVLCVALILDACSRNSESRMHVELRDAPEANLPKQSTPDTTPTSCPPGDPHDSDESSTPPGGHTVNLSWNASTSATGPLARDIRYCLYRTKGGRVQRNDPGTATPCVYCQRVTKDPVAGTAFLDTQVESGVHYCYVAIAIDRGTGKLSVFSNQADAVIPPNKERPFCTPNGDPKQAPSAQSPRRR